MGRVRPKYMGWAKPGPKSMGWAEPGPKIHGLGSSPAHHNWLLCLSTITSFPSPAEMCTVHVLHGEGRNESKGKGGRVFTWSGGVAGDCWWQRRRQGRWFFFFFSPVLCSVFFFFSFSLLLYFSVLSSFSGLLFSLCFGLSQPSLLSLGFFFIEQCMKRRRFSQNTLFHLNGFWHQTRRIQN